MPIKRAGNIKKKVKTNTGEQDVLLMYEVRTEIGPSDIASHRIKVTADPPIAYRGRYNWEDKTAKERDLTQSYYEGPLKDTTQDALDRAFTSMMDQIGGKVVGDAEPE